MLKSLSLKNFKSFLDTGNVSFSPFTIISGQNSSGKSTLLQALLIFKQSLDTPISDEAIVLNGMHISLGGFSDILHSQSIYDSIDFNFEFSNILDEYSHEETDYPIKSYINLINTFIDDISLAIQFGSAKDEIDMPRLLKWSAKGVSKKRIDFEVMFKINNALIDKLANSYEFENDHFMVENGSLLDVEKVKGFDWKPEGAFFNSVFPDYFLKPYHKKLIDQQNCFLEELFRTLFEFSSIKFPQNNREENKWNRYLNILKRKNKIAIHSNLLNSQDEVNNVVELIYEILSDRTEIRDMEYRRVIEHILLNLESEDLDRFKYKLLRWLGDIKQINNSKKFIKIENVRHLNIDKTPLDFEDIRHYFRFAMDKVYYLGPLREEPRSFYSRIGSKDPMYVGQKGENLAFVLKYYSTKNVQFVLPPENIKSWYPTKEKLVPLPLREAVDIWLKYLGIAKEIRIDEFGKVGLSIRANIYGDKDSTLTNVGVGVSQVLPLVVLGLISPPDSIIALEQPELHLHPYVQSRLADFFLSLIAAKKQVIVETHSEHLILRTRYHIARGAIKTGKHVSVYFCQRDDNAQFSTISKIKIDDFGSIVNWPTGFFDETTQLLEEILLSVLDRDDVR